MLQAPQAGGLVLDTGQAVRNTQLTGADLRRSVCAVAGTAVRPTFPLLSRVFLSGDEAWLRALSPDADVAGALEEVARVVRMTRRVGMYLF